MWCQPHDLQAVKLIADPLYRSSYHTIENRLAEKGQRASKHKDPQAGTMLDAPSPEQYLALARYLMVLCATDSRAARDLSLFLFMTAGMGRWVMSQQLPPLTSFVLLKLLPDCPC